MAGPQSRLGDLRRAAARALSIAYQTGVGVSVVGHQLDVFLFEPGSDHYLGRLCSYSRCPNDKRDCLATGCGAVAFNKRIVDFTPRADLLAGIEDAMLFRRGVGRLRSALDLPTPDADQARRR